MIKDLRPFYERDRQETIEYSFPDDDSLIFGEVFFLGTIKSMAQLIKLDGTASFGVKTSCARCLEPIEREITVPVSHYLVRESDESQDDDVYITVDDDKLDLDELINEDIQLAMPSRFLCKSDCKGLCRQCGKNLNEGDCSCKRPVDPRLQALADLLD